LDDYINVELVWIITYSPSAYFFFKNASAVEENAPIVEQLIANLTNAHPYLTVYRREVPSMVSLHHFGGVN